MQLVRAISVLLELSPQEEKHIKEYLDYKVSLTSIKNRVIAKNIHGYRKSVFNDEGAQEKIITGNFGKSVYSLSINFSWVGTDINCMNWELNFGLFVLLLNLLV